LKLSETTKLQLIFSGLIIAFTLVVVLSFVALLAFTFDVGREDSEKEQEISVL